MPRLHPDDRFLLRIRCVLAHRRIAQPSPLRIARELVFQLSGQHVDFFASSSRTTPRPLARGPLHELNLLASKSMERYHAEIALARQPRSSQRIDTHLRRIVRKKLMQLYE